MKRWTGFEHGINLGGWLSQCVHTKEHYDTFIGEEDVKKVSEWGLDHVRVPVDYDLVEDENGNYKEEGFSYIQNIIDWTRTYHLNMILDLHKTFGFSFDKGENESGFFEKEEYQERFYKLWEEFAKRYGKYEDMIAFELLNEITDKSYCEAWNRISNRCIERIRKTAPDIRILVGGYYNNSVEAVKDLTMPYDENIVYNFHCYEPLVFTHQGAYWVDGMKEDFRISVDADYGEMKEQSKNGFSQIAVGFDGFDENETLSSAYFDKFFSEAVKVAEERDVPLYCGEYGVINRAVPEDILKWYQIINESFRRFGIGRAAWNYKAMDFGFTDERMEAVLPDVLGAMKK